MAGSDRNANVAVAEETVQILKRGTYTAQDTLVNLKDVLKAACDGTEFHDQTAPLRIPNADHKTDVQVTDETTLGCVYKLCKDPSNGVVGVLNFANATHPGGSFLRGVMAQEETLATCSGLYSCLTTPQAKQFYESHGSQPGAKKASKPGRRFFGGAKKKSEPAPATTTTSTMTPVEQPYRMYTSNVIHSPNVPIFRDDKDMSLIPTPYTCHVITSCAVNFNVGMFSKKKLTREEKQIPLQALSLRAFRVLQVAAHHKVDTLVLGAWGCGVFKNDPYDVAKAFKAAMLHPHMEHAFKKIVFAVPEDPKNPDTKFWFAKEFAKEKADPRKTTMHTSIPRW